MAPRAERDHQARDLDAEAEVVASFHSTAESAEVMDMEAAALLLGWAELAPMPITTTDELAKITPAAILVADGLVIFGGGHLEGDVPVEKLLEDRRAVLEKLLIHRWVSF